MKANFLQPRFDGARFTEHTLPLEVAKDLAAYETLVIELAKHLYIHDHPERQRVPKGFAADFQLHLERVDDGCARPLLSVVSAGMLAMGVAGNVYFERARELITECIAAPDGQLPTAFPRELLAHFNQVGRSLREDERMELAGVGGIHAVLTPDRRKKLVLEADTVYERPIELTGTIVEANWEKSSFQIRLADGTLAVVPMPESFHAQARNYGGRPRHQVTVQGVGAFDSWDRLQKIVSVDSLEVQPDYQLAVKFDELRALADGWHDRHGVAPDKVKIDQIVTKMIGHYPERLPLPAIVPTPEGNLLLEWDVPGEPSVDVRLSDLKAEFHAFIPETGDLERDFDLSVADEWAGFFGFLVQNIGQRLA